MNSISRVLQVADLAPQHIATLTPYQGGKPIAELARETGLQEAEIIKLASNENPLGMSRVAALALQTSLQGASLYPDGYAFELRAAIARKFIVAPDQIVLGNGSNDILELAARAFLNHTSEAIYSQYAFAIFGLIIQAVGATSVIVAARDFGHDLEAMLSAITASTRLIFIANPNNPTGTFVGKDRVLQFLRQVPPSVLVVLDEAYNEYLADAEQSEAVQWLGEFNNLIVCRTFSKAYGLAGLRVGFGLMNGSVARVLNSVRQPFNVNTLAQVAAVAALTDDDFVAHSRAINSAGLAQLCEGFKALSLFYIPSHANFVTVRVANAPLVNQALLKNGIIVRPVAAYGLMDYLRISVGLEWQNAKLLNALSKILNVKS